MEIKSWMTINLLKLNDDKTELLLIIKNKLKNVSPACRIELNSVPIFPSTTIRNLGVYFDQYMNMESFVNAKCKAAMFALRNISRVRSSLTMDACKTLIQAYVLSKLDYCNCLLYGLPSQSISRLQRVQNYAARVITMTRKYDHITPVLAQLHWLPIQQRIKYKLLLYVFKALHGLGPAYMSDLVVPYRPSRTLRSAGKCNLTEPRFNLSNYGGRAFSSAAPRLWNKLPSDIKSADSLPSFKSHLKTHLFHEAYHCPFYCCFA